MKAIFQSVLPIILVLAALPLSGQTTGQSVYMRSSISQPWGQGTNEDAMDNVFGPGNWSTQFYETADPNVLLSSATSFIFMEGGDSSYLPFASFLNSEGPQLTTWIMNGGRLLIVSAPNNPLTDTSLYLPGNIVLKSDAFYGSAASSAYATDILNPIFWGPNVTALLFTGDFFSHGYFEGPSIQPIMSTNLNQVVLGQYVTGTGLMVYGGMTTDNFHLPQPAAHSLVENIIYYTAYVALS